ncbi:MAG: flagellar hook-associated protein FlgL [Clostridiaceae bacterium]|nr:flagellar hook-associated protein FlgL [Eubacteriales bacterium]
MRVTTGMISGGYMRNINNNLTQLQKYEYQLSSQKRLTKLSDDPIGIVRSMQARVKLANLERYQDSVESAQSWLTQTETSLNELNEVLKKVYESSVQASTDTLSEEDRKSISEEIAEMRDHLVTVGNSKFGDKYIFAGYNTSVQPFTVDSATGKLLYNGVDMSDSANAQLGVESGEVIEYSLGLNLRMDVSITGIQLLGVGEDNLYNLMNDYYNALESGASASDLAEYTEKFSAAQSRTLSNLAEIGGKTNRLKLLENRYSVDEVNFTEIKSKVEDIDVAEVTVQWKTAMAVYEYALKIGSSILQNSLVDYMR